jgi:hypothetical protein
MVIARILGWLSIAAAIAVAALGLALWLTGQDLGQAAGRLWHDLDPASLNEIQAVIQRYIHPGLWDHVLVPVLGWPAYRVLALSFPVPFVLGGLLVVLFKKREKKRFFSRPPA